MTLHGWYSPKPEHVISIDAAATLIGVHPDTLRRAVARGEDVGFPVFKAGRRYTVAKKPLYRLLGIEEP